MSDSVSSCKFQKGTNTLTDKNNNTVSTGYLQNKFVNPDRSSLGLSFDFTNGNLTLKYMGGVSGYSVITALTITSYPGSSYPIIN